MINRKHRFHGHGSLRFVYQHGKTLRGLHGSIKYIRNPRRNTYRLAVVVSRKVHKSAVVRNRIRRRLYEVAREYESQFTGPYDMVFTVFSDSIATMDAQELRQRVHDKLQEAGIVAPNPDDGAKTHAIVRDKE